MLTESKKNYAGLVQYRLGKDVSHLPFDDRTDIKGLAIRKTVVPKKLRTKFKNMLVNKVLSPDAINPREVMKEYNKISDEIEFSLRSGSTEYLTPASVSKIESYKTPEGQEGVRGVIVWNALEPDLEIALPDNIRLAKLICGDRGKDNLEKVRAISEEKYEIIESTVYNTNPGEIDISHFGFDVCALPQDLEVIPDYLMPVLNFSAIVNKNVSNANKILKSLGLYCVDDSKQKTNYKSNIIEL